MASRGPRLPACGKRLAACGSANCYITRTRHGFAKAAAFESTHAVEHKHMRKQAVQLVGRALVVLDERAIVAHAH